jgi:hypothetical protein
MKKLILIHLVLLITLTPKVSFSQDLGLKWSKDMVYQNKIDGFFKQYITSTDESIYALYTNLSAIGNGEEKLKIVSFNKHSLNKESDAALKGYPENNATKFDYKGLDFLNIHVMDGHFFVFWNKFNITKSEKTEELYVETFDLNLKRVGNLKKVLTAKLDKEIKYNSSWGSTFILISNKDFDQNMIVGYEYHEVDKPAEFRYSIIDSELEVGNLEKVKLPALITSKKMRANTSSYTFGKDGNIYVQTRIALKKEEKEEASKWAQKSYLVFSAIDPSTNNFTSFELRKENINFNDIEYVITDNKIKIYGFFCDLLKDKLGASTHGIFHSEINSETLVDEGVSLTYFDEATISKLFKDDQEDMKKTSKKAKKKQEKSGVKNADKEALDIRFKIEDMFVMDNEDVVLFFSKMYNYSVTTCTSSPNGGQSCHTNYYCKKSNVTSIKLSQEGEIIWASNLDRQITYNNWNIYDIKVVKNGNDFFVIYGSAFSKDAEKKNRKSSKKRSELRDEFEYATFNIETGAYKKYNFQVNSSDIVDKKLRKSVDPVAITVMDDKFYVNYVKVRPMSYLYCAYCLIFSPGMIKADANLGRISIMEGGKSKRK